ncbi:MAG: DegT/DnrJ/EryC1/StrS family aminotransferase [Candidatus Micrarchaeia archaeon]
MIKVRVGDFRIGAEEKEAVEEVLRSGRISEGPKTCEFEKRFANFVGTEHAVVLSSGTSAIIAGLTVLKYDGRFSVKQGSKVLTTPLTYIATSNAIVLSGLEPVYVDVDERTFGITPENIRAHLEEIDDPKDYSLILPVHLMGYACDMDGINRLASEYGLIVFEDSAQAHGTVYNGKKTGSLSLLADFSFYIAHNIQAGEMGALVTNDSRIARLVRKVKANGRMCDCHVCTRSKGSCPRAPKKESDSDPRFTHDVIGYNFKVMEFQAALGLVQLEKAQWIIERRRENVKYLNDCLSKFEGILRLPLYSENVSYLAYPLVVEDKKVSRMRLMKKLEELGVETRPLFGCIPTQQPAYAHLRKKYEGRLPNAEMLGKMGFYIGCHQYLTQEDLEYVVKCFANALG